MRLPVVTLFYGRIESGDRRLPHFTAAEHYFALSIPPSTHLQAKVDAGWRLTPLALDVND